jgi:hypothetical protein
MSKGRGWEESPGNTEGREGGVTRSTNGCGGQALPRHRPLHALLSNHPMPSAQMVSVHAYIYQLNSISEVKE